MEDGCLPAAKLQIQTWPDQKFQPTNLNADIVLYMQSNITLCLNAKCLGKFHIRNIFRVKNSKQEVKFTLEEAVKAQRGSRGTALALDGGEWLTPCTSHFTSIKQTWHPLYRRKGGPQSQFGWVSKISPSLGFDPRTVQHVDSHYTDYTILAHPKQEVYQQILCF
jgi:hypothetical protein